MFRNIVSNLPFSPALVGQLGFYAKRLKKEEATRRLGLIFTALALVVQSFAVFSPPEAVNASNGSDFIRGGISSKQELMSAYDSSSGSSGDLKEIFDYAGITRQELADTHETSLNSQNAPENSAWLSWGRESRFSEADGQVAHDVAGTTIYSRPVKNYENTDYERSRGINYSVLQGYSKKIGTFAIMKSCGNLVTTRVPAGTPPPAAESNIIRSKKATNKTQHTNSIKVSAEAGDKIEFTLSAKNTGDAAGSVEMTDEIADLLEYATMDYDGGGTFNPDSKTLSWGEIELAPGQTESRSFTVKILRTIPSTGTGLSDSTSYDCQISNSFGNTVNVNIDCPVEKIVVEQVVAELPKTGPGENIIFAGVILSVVAYFYARSRQIGKEIRMIRRDLNAGTI